MQTNSNKQNTTFTVGDQVAIDDPWSFVRGLGTVTAVEPWALGSTAVTVALTTGQTTRTHPCYLQAVAA